MPDKKARVVYNTNAIIHVRSEIFFQIIQFRVV